MEQKLNISYLYLYITQEIQHAIADKTHFKKIFHLQN